MAKKLRKLIDGSVVTFEILTEDGDTKTKIYDTSELPAAIQAKLAPFGLGHKLGDAAAGCSDPDDIEASIDTVWTALLQGEWSLRKPAEPKEKTPKISKKSLLEGLQNLSDDEKAMAQAVLAKLGIVI